MPRSLSPSCRLVWPRGDKNTAQNDESKPWKSELILCSASSDHGRRRKRISELHVLIPGTSAPDILFSWTGEYLVQEHLYRLFDSERITGIWTRPADAVLKRTGEPLAVRELGLSGWGGVAPPESGIREVLRCRVCGNLMYSKLRHPEKLINLEAWDGSDFFMVWPLPRYIFVTKKVVELFKTHKISGARFTQELEPSVSDTYSPGRLSYYMPEERAHLLGDPLGIF